MLQFHYVQIANKKTGEQTDWSGNPVTWSAHLTPVFLERVPGSAIGSLALTNTEQPRNA